MQSDKTKAEMKQALTNWIIRHLEAQEQGDTKTAEVCKRMAQKYIDKLGGNVNGDV